MGLEAVQTSAHSPGPNPMAALQGNWEAESSPVLKGKGSLKAAARATPESYGSPYGVKSLRTGMEALNCMSWAPRPAPGAAG